MNLDQSFEGQRFARTADIAATIAAVTNRGDFIVTDEAEQAFHAQRLVPPNLADPSSGRVRARELTRRGDRDGGRGPATSRWSRSPATAPLAHGFRLWLDEHFEPIKVYGRGGDSPQAIYVRTDADMAQTRRALEGFIQTPTMVDFGILRLTGYSLDRRVLMRNGNVGVTCEWEALTRAAIDYIVTELVGPDGQVWATSSCRSRRGVGLDEWTPGRWMFQSSTFDVAATAPAGVTSCASASTTARRRPTCR